MLGKIRQYEWGQKKEGLDNQIRSSDNMAGNKRSIQFSTTQATEKKKQCLRMSSKTEYKTNKVRLKTGKLGKK